MKYNTSKVDIDNKIVEKIHQNNFFADNFIRLFVAIYICEENYSFNKDMLFEYIYFCKEFRKYDELLNNISIRIYKDSFVSLELNTAIEKLVQENILTGKNIYSDSLVDINDHISSSKLIYGNKKFIEEMCKFVTDYRKYEINRISMYYQDFDNEKEIVKNEKKLSRVLTVY